MLKIGMTVKKEICFLTFFQANIEYIYPSMKPSFIQDWVNVLPKPKHFIVNDDTKYM
jgi:hypothetical protein